MAIVNLILNAIAHLIVRMCICLISCTQKLKRESEFSVIIVEALVSFERLSGDMPYLSDEQHQAHCEANETMFNYMNIIVYGPI